MKRSILDAILNARGEKRPVALATDLETGAQSLIDSGTVDGDLDVGSSVIDAVQDVLRADKGQTIAAGNRQIFLQPFNPPLRLAIVGAVHIAQALAPMATIAGYDVTVIDPRETFATATRFPGIALSTDWPDEALDALRPDTRTAIVTLTHDPKLDDPALHRALRSPAFYIGCLGSRKTHATRLARLADAGFEGTATDRIHGPIGLAIGAKSPAEIAIAVMGQITDTLRKPTPASAEAA